MMHSQHSFIHAPLLLAPLPPRWTCRRRSHSGSSKSSAPPTPSRGRGAKRAALHAARDEYRAHFAPLLAAESRAEQAAWAAASRAPAPLCGVRVLRKKGRVMSGTVYVVGGAGRGRRRIASDCALRKGDVVTVSDVGGDGEVEGSVMERGAWEILVTVPIGSDGARVMDAFVAEEVEVSVEQGASGIAVERALAALEILTGNEKDGKRESEISLLVVRSLADEGAKMKTGTTRGPTKKAVLAAGGPDSHKRSRWEEAARAYPPSSNKAAIASAVREVCASLQLPLNLSQRAAVKHSLERSVSIVQGPPGTGKTVVAACIISAAVHAGCGPVLATASSNVAVDNLLEKLLVAGKGSKRLLNIVRVGRVAAVDKTLWDYTLEGILEKDPVVRRAREDADRNPAGASKSWAVEKQAAHRILRRANVVLTTCVGAGRDIFDELSFRFILCDEATQSTEPDLIVPLMAGSAPSLRQLVLVGDHHQLPPTVLCQGDEGENLSCSLFSRFWSAGIVSMMLDTQYRMHPQIAAFPAQHFYFSKLVTAVSEKDRPLHGCSVSKAAVTIDSGATSNLRLAQDTKAGVSGSESLGRPYGVDSEALMGLLRKNRVLFIDSESGLEERDSALRELDAAFSYVNRVEARLVNNIVHQLPLAPTNIAVISPYSAQVRLISRALANDFNFQVEVSSVDGFQGREKDVIVFSAVRSNDEGRVGFLADWRRLNVALTRARNALIVVGSPSTLEYDPHWKAWLRAVPSVRLSSLGKVHSL